MRRNLIALAACGILALSAVPAAAQSVHKAPPPAPYKKVSELVKLPDFIPGMGTLYVDPKTLPDVRFSLMITRASSSARSTWSR
jgi:hypothetical protein